MMRPLALERLRPVFDTAAPVHRRPIRRLTSSLALGAFLSASLSAAQVLTIDTSGKGPVTANAPVDRQFMQIAPTHVALSKTPLDPKTRLEIVRIMQAEQGFAMRPFPAGHKGLTLTANGDLNPAGEAYLNMAISNGLSVKPGGRVVVTDVKVDHNKIIFDLNGGPDAKHRFLRHIQIGMGPEMDSPVVADDGQEPVGSRLTLVFKGGIPELTGDQVKALLAPLISFDVKTPVQAYTDTLPKPLKEAILNHQVLVGMNTEMVMFAKGEPVNKIREMDGQMPIEILDVRQAAADGGICAHQRQPGDPGGGCAHRAADAGVHEGRGDADARGHAGGGRSGKRECAHYPRGRRAARPEQGGAGCAADLGRAGGKACPRRTIRA